MPLLHARPEPNDGGYAVVDYGAVEPALGHDGRPARARRRAARGGDGAVRRRRPQPHRARAPVGAGGARGRRADAGLLPHVRGPQRARRLRAHAARGLPRHRARAASPGCPSSSAGCGRRSTPTSGTSTTRTPRSSARWPRRCSSSPRVGVDVLRLDAVPFLWKRMGTNCQNQPEVHELLQAFRAADADRGARGRLQGRGDRLPARPRRLPRRGPPRGQGVRPRLPQRPHGAAVERARLGARRADDAHAARDAAGPAGRGLGDLRALPRRHRLGDHRGGRGRRRRGRATCTGASWPTSTPASSPARSRAARASSPTRAPARRARAARPPRWPGSRRRSSAATSWRCELAIRRVLLLYAVAFAHGGLPLDLHGRRARPAQRPRRGPTIRRTRDDNRWMHRPPMDWDGGRAPRTTRRRSRGGCGTGCGGWSPRAAPRARPTRRAPPSRCGPATTTSSACCASTPASACCCSRTSRPSGSRSTSPWCATAASSSAGAPRARRAPAVQAQGDVLVLEPYQYLWLRG